MIIKIERAILHALDPAAGVAVLSEEPMDINEEVREFLDAHFTRCMESDEAQRAALREEGSFGQRMRGLGRAVRLADRPVRRISSQKADSWRSRFFLYSAPIRTFREGT